MPHGQGAGDAGPADASGTTLIRTRRPLGHARLWRLIVSNRSCLTLIKTSCTLSPGADGLARSQYAVTISQGRLLRLLPRLATLNMAAVSDAAFADLFSPPAAPSEPLCSGLLQWAALGMVDKSDLLMHCNLVDFFETLVSVMRVSARTPKADATLKSLVKAGTRDDATLVAALTSLPNRTVEEEAEALRRYINELLD